MIETGLCMCSELLKKSKSLQLTLMVVSGFGFCGRDDFFLAFSSIFFSRLSWSWILEDRGEGQINL